MKIKQIGLFRFIQNHLKEVCMKRKGDGRGMKLSWYEIIVV